MALSAKGARKHVNTWSEKLRRSPLSANWPAHLFHATDLENAVAILINRRLICRQDLDGNIPCDVANQGALWNNPQAHRYVRLYFRPRTNFHLSTEGIKCLGDRYRRDPHMSIPVMFAFDALSLLTLEGVRFSRGKLSRRLPTGEDDEFFQSIDFDSVYHDGPIPREADHDIQDKRMAEVIVPGDLPLQPYLRKLICRTPLERRTLLHRLAGHAEDLAAMITVEQIQQSTFLHKSLYLTGVSLRAGVLSFDLHAPTVPPVSGEYCVEVEHWIGGKKAQNWKGKIPATWRGASIPGFREIQGGFWRIRLEEALAYEASIPSEIVVIR
jgi:hypothetical protein